MVSCLQYDRNSQTCNGGCETASKTNSFIATVIAISTTIDTVTITVDVNATVKR